MRFEAGSKNRMLSSRRLCVRSKVIRPYLCLLLFSAVDGTTAGGLAAIDLDRARLEPLDWLDRDPDAREVLAQIFSLALGSVSGVEENSADVDIYCSRSFLDTRRMVMIAAPQSMAVIG